MKVPNMHVPRALPQAGRIGILYSTIQMSKNGHEL